MYYLLQTRNQPKVLAFAVWVLLSKVPLWEEAKRPIMASICCPGQNYTDVLFNMLYTRHHISKSDVSFNSHRNGIAYSQGHRSLRIPSVHLQRLEYMTPFELFGAAFLQEDGRFSDLYWPCRSFMKEDGRAASRSGCDPAGVIYVVP